VHFEYILTFSHLCLELSKLEWPVVYSWCHTACVQCLLLPHRPPRNPLGDMSSDEDEDESENMSDEELQLIKALDEETMEGEGSEEEEESENETEEANADG